MSASHSPPDGAEPAHGLLDRPAEESARRLALGHLAQARRARGALGAGDDVEALHDLRVALRRLRSTLRAFDAELRPAVGGKARRRLRRLARATAGGRDAEVGAAIVARWLGDLRDSRERRAASALRDRLAEDRQRAYAELDERFGRRVDALLDRIETRLSVWRREVRVAAEPTPPEPLRRRVADELARLRLRFEAALDEAADGEARPVHAARVEAKRLRYLLEPLVDELAPAAAPVRRLRRLQDLLGNANDLAVLGAGLADVAAAAERERVARLAAGERRGAPSPGGRRGQQQLAARVAGERRALAAAFASAWLSPRGAERRRTARELDAVAAALAR